MDLWPPFSGFLDHTQLDTRYDSSGQVISPSQRPLPTQDNTTYNHKRQTSMPRAEFEPATPATKRPQTARPLGSAANTTHIPLISLAPCSQPLTIYRLQSIQVSYSYKTPGNFGA
jgi:hypothetical protein